MDDGPVNIRALIVDDEPLARERLVSLLASESDIEVAGQCANGAEALAAIADIAARYLPPRAGQPAQQTFSVPSIPILLP